MFLWFYQLTLNTWEISNASPGFCPPQIDSPGNESVAVSKETIKSLFNLTKNIF
jgi:hypothetical protein